jgi:hypothetical protein
MNVPAPSQFLISFPPNFFPQLLLLVSAVSEEMLPRPDCFLAPPVLVIISLSEALEVSCSVCIPALELVVSRGEWLLISHWDWAPVSYFTRLASVPVVSAALLALPSF